MIQNIVILGGRMTANPELKQTTGGKSVCHFGVAYNPPPRYVDGVRKDAAPVYVPITAWGKNAEKVVRDFRRGSPILINGQLESGSYTANKGTANEELIYTNGVKMNYCQKISVTGLNQNFVLFSGHLARKPEVHQLDPKDPSRKISTLVLISNGFPYPDGNGGMTEGEKTTMDCVVRDKDAENLAKHSDRGTGIWVMGKLYTHSYQTKKGKKSATLLKVSVKEWGFASNKKDAVATTNAAEAGAQTNSETVSPSDEAEHHAALAATAAANPASSSDYSDEAPF